jgi:hypothetical protein
MAAAAAKIPTVVCDMETTTPAARKKKQRTKHPAPARKSPVKTRSRTAEAEKVAEQEAVESYRMSFTAPAPVPDDVDRFFLPEYLERPKTPEFVLDKPIQRFCSDRINKTAEMWQTNGLPTRDQIFKLFQYESEAIRFCVDVGITPIEYKYCHMCRSFCHFEVRDPVTKKPWIEMEETYKDIEVVPKRFFVIRCNCRKGGISYSLFKGSMLERIKVKKTKWLEVVYSWMLDKNIKTIAIETGIGEKAGKPY